MIYKKQISLGKFLKKGTDICDGDIITIANEGKVQEGQYGEQNIFLVKLKGGEEGNVSINQTSINTFIDGWGEDSVNWIGKEVKIEVIKMSVSGKIRQVYFFLHPDSILDDESGQFIIPNKEKSALVSTPIKDEEIPVIEADDPNAEAQEASDEEKKN